MDESESEGSHPIGLPTAGSESAEAALVPVEEVTTTPSSSNEPVTVPEVPSVQRPENLGQTRRRKIVIPTKAYPLRSRNASSAS